MRILAIISALVVGFIVFVLAGLFIQPLIPTSASHTVSVFEMDYWRDNIVGAVLGVAAVYIAHRSAMRYFERREKEKKGNGSASEGGGE